MPYRNLIPVLFLVPVLGLRAQEDRIIAGGYTLTTLSLDCASYSRFSVADRRLFKDDNQSDLQRVADEALTHVRQFCPTATTVALLSRNGKSQRLVKGSVGTAPPATPAARAQRAVPTPERPASTAAVAAEPAEAVPVERDPTLSPLASARKREDKCEVLLAWLGRIDREMGAAGRGAYNRPVALNIFRDSIFVPVFGLSYDRSSSAWRQQLWTETISWCMGVQQPSRSRVPNPLAAYRRPPKAPATAPQFQPYARLLRSAFESSAGGLSYNQIVGAVDELESSRQWMEDALQRAARKPASVEQASQIEKDQEEAKQRLTNLWPNERRYFEDQITALQAQAFASVVDQWIDGFDDFPATFEGAMALTAYVREREPILPLWKDRQIERRWQEAYSERAGELVKGPAESAVAQLQSLPKTLEGLRKAVRWHDNLQKELTYILPNQQLRELEETYRTWREAALSESAEQWASLWADGKLESAEGVRAAEEELAILFPPRYQAGVGYQSFSARIVAARERVDEAAALEKEARAKQRAAQGGYVYREGNYWDSFHNPAILRPIFDGDSKVVRGLQKAFESYYVGYVLAYSGMCREHLPPGSHVLTLKEWDEDQYGNRTNERETQTFVAPYMYDKFLEYRGEKSRDGQTAQEAMQERFAEFGRTIRTAIQPGGLNVVAAQLGERIRKLRDMQALLGRDGCTGATTKQFEQNLVRIANGQPSVQEQSALSQQ